MIKILKKMIKSFYSEGYIKEVEYENIMKASKHVHEDGLLYVCMFETLKELQIEGIISDKNYKIKLLEMKLDLLFKEQNTIIKNLIREINEEIR